MAVAVTVFNSSPLPVQVSVNNGAQFQIAGAGPYNGFAPQASTYGGPGWSNTTRAPNVLAPGSNVLTVTTQGALEPVVVTVSLPNSVQWNSLQLYFFPGANNRIGWVALNNGLLVVQGF